MALSIGGIYAINQISRSDFKEEASMLGLGSGIAMKHFDALTAGFEKAVCQAKEELKEQGFQDIDVIAQQILRKGAINKYL